MPTSFSRLLLAAFTLAAALGAPLAGAGAQSIERLGDFSDWSAFKYEEGGKAVCFIASEPTKAEGNYTTRGKIHALVTHRPGEQRTDEVSIPEIGRAHVCTPVATAHLVCLLLLEK